MCAKPPATSGLLTEAPRSLQGDLLHTHTLSQADRAGTKQTGNLVRASAASGLIGLPRIWQPGAVGSDQREGTLVLISVLC